MPAFTRVRKRLLLFLASLPLFGVVAAFGLAPDTVVEPIPQVTVTQAIELPAPTPLDSGPFDFWREERIGYGDTLPHLLRRLGVAEEEIVRTIPASRESEALARLIAGRTVLARVSSGGRLILLRYLATDDRLVTLERVGEGFRAREETIRPEIRYVMRSGEIQSSLFAATDALDVPDAITVQLAEVFSGDIDFHRDLRRGDRFALVYETYVHQGSTVKTGRLLAAEFINEGKTYRALYFRDPQGHEGYYTPNGQSLRRAFLKSPMPFSRISSGYSLARFHPVLKEWRAHKGIDYAAPTGSPVRAVADAVVEFAGRKGGYGNLIVLAHQRPYSTAYGHLSRFAKGIRRGARVRQGEIIGYVGSTGLATGPHLHYEFRVGGVPRNPLTVKLPTSYPLAARYRSQFAAATQPLVARLDLLRGSHTVLLD